MDIYDCTTSSTMYLQNVPLIPNLNFVSIKHELFSSFSS